MKALHRIEQVLSIAIVCTLLGGVAVAVAPVLGI